MRILPRPQFSLTESAAPFLAGIDELVKQYLTTSFERRVPCSVTQSTRVEREIEFLKRAERSTAIDRDTGGRGGGGVKKRPRVEAVKFPYKRFLPNTLATELVREERGLEWLHCNA